MNSTQRIGATSRDRATAAMPRNIAPTRRGCRVAGAAWPSLTRNNTIEPAITSRAAVVSRVDRNPKASMIRPPNSGPTVNPRKLADIRTPTAYCKRCLGAIAVTTGMAAIKGPGQKPQEQPQPQQAVDVGHEAGGEHQHGKAESAAHHVLPAAGSVADHTPERRAERHQETRDAADDAAPQRRLARVLDSQLPYVQWKKREYAAEADHRQGYRQPQQVQVALPRLPGLESIWTWKGHHFSSGRKDRTARMNCAAPSCRFPLSRLVLRRFGS